MRLKYVVLFLLLFSASSAFSQSSVATQKLSRVDSLEKRIDSITRFQKEFKTTVLEERINQATETIANQNAIVSSFGTLYTIITIILALIGIALPILTYQFGIKPSQKALEDFQKNAESKFDDFLKQSKKIEIDNAIKNLEDEDLAVKNNALSFLSLNYYISLSEIQINKIIGILKKPNLDEAFINQLYHILSNQKSELVKNYFDYNVEQATEGSMFMYYAIKSLSYFGYDEYRSTIQKYLKGKSKFFDVSIYIQQLAKADLQLFFNDKEIIDALSNDEIKNMAGSYEHYLNVWKITAAEFGNTYLSQKINTKS